MSDARFWHVEAVCPYTGDPYEFTIEAATRADADARVCWECDWDGYYGPPHVTGEVSAPGEVAGGEE